jgi:uncharacterized protein (UPF0248 family)
MEPFAVLSDAIQDEATLDSIDAVCKQRYGHYTKAHHEWIDRVEPGLYRQSLEKARTNPTLFKAMETKFPNHRIVPVTETDEVYWAASPKEAKGSDRALVDCHYDAPFGIIPTGGVMYYRIIIAVNENDTVTTVFPDEEKRVKMNKGDFHGLDYNKDWHCVEGSIRPGHYRVLLKLHYLLIPEHASSGWVSFVRWINVQWTVLSRATMRMSADPQTPWETLVGWIVNICRYIFNHTTATTAGIVGILVVALVSWFLLSGSRRTAKK